MTITPFFSSIIFLVVFRPSTKPPFSSFPVRNFSPSSFFPRSECTCKHFFSPIYFLQVANFSFSSLLLSPVVCARPYTPPFPLFILLDMHFDLLQPVHPRTFSFKKQPPPFSTPYLVMNGKDNSPFSLTAKYNGVQHTSSTLLVDTFLVLLMGVHTSPPLQCLSLLHLEGVIGFLMTHLSFQLPPPSTTLFAITLRRENFAIIFSPVARTNSLTLISFPGHLAFYVFRTLPQYFGKSFSLLMISSPAEFPVPRMPMLSTCGVPFQVHLALAFSPTHPSFYPLCCSNVMNLPG